VTGSLINDWAGYLGAGVLVLVRLSGLMVFAPILSSGAISPQIKAGLAVAMTILLAPVVAALPGARPVLDFQAILGELGIGLVFGLTLTMLNEALNFAGTVLGFEFSFSLVSLLDPNTMIETPVLGQMLGWLGILVILGAGLHRTLLLAVMRSFSVVPIGQAVIAGNIGAEMSRIASGLFFAGLQLSAPILAAALTVEMTVALIGRLSPQLPVLVISIPLKTIISYLVLIGSLAAWPGWIEHHFDGLLDAASKLITPARAVY
jgi:flagellar biosynthetic protein FliR